ncbi:MAG: hypothetical protein ACRC6R_08875, partial [Bacteroidales bacterium]
MSIVTCNEVVVIEHGGKKYSIGANRNSLERLVEEFSLEEFALERVMRVIRDPAPLVPSKHIYNLLFMPEVCMKVLE